MPASAEPFLDIEQADLGCEHFVGCRGAGRWQFVGGYYRDEVALVRDGQRCNGHLAESFCLASAVPLGRPGTYLMTCSLGRDAV